MLVQVLKNWHEPDLKRQTPRADGVWENIRFSFGPIDQADFTIVLNHVSTRTEVQCPNNRLWTIVQEPPNEDSRHLHRPAKVFSRVYTQDTSLKGGRYILSQPALPWHVNKSYSYLKESAIPAKEKALSWITSASTDTLGHRKRMKFLKKLEGLTELDLFGRGFTPIEDKWDGLAPYKYSIAIENFQNPHYWSEKVADCLLSWTLPIYAGCSRLSDYLPEDSFVQIDLDDPDPISTIRGIIDGNLWEQRLDSIAEARRRILDEHQLFPFLTREIKTYLSGEYSSEMKKIVLVNPEEGFSRKAYVWRKQCYRRLKSIVKQQLVRHESGLLLPK